MKDVHLSWSTKDKNTIQQLQAWVTHRNCHALRVLKLVLAARIQSRNPALHHFVCNMLCDFVNETFLGPFWLLIMSWRGGTTAVVGAISRRNRVWGLRQEWMSFWLKLSRGLIIFLPERSLHSLWPQLSPIPQQKIWKINLYQGSRPNRSQGELSRIETFCFYISFPPSGAFRRAEKAKDVGVSSEFC